MKPVEVYCCGEIITCTEAINECDNCGAKYDVEGDRMYDREIQEDTEEEPSTVSSAAE